MINERYLLSIERIRQIANEGELASSISDFFKAEADFLLYADKVYTLSIDNKLCKLDLDELRTINRTIYGYKADASNEYLKALDAELKAVIPYAYEADLYNLVIRYELFLEFYSAYLCASEADEEIKPEVLKDILYYFAFDYTEEATAQRIGDLFNYDNAFAVKLINEHDFKNVSDLYLYGEYVTKVEEETLEHINSLDEATIKKMADTFTEGYRIGFEVTNKDISKKKLVEIRYHLGFEPVVKVAMENFKKLGLDTVLRRSVRTLLGGRGINAIGYEGASFDKQYIFDHKDDLALILDKMLNNVRIEALKKAFEKQKERAALFGGPAVMEVFGEEPFEYANNEKPDYSDEQQACVLKYISSNGEITREYIKEEERSFTIIAFPTPDIGPDFKEIFNEVIKLNTLDYMLYRKVQQTIIDTLDKGDYCIVKGANGNKTNLKVNLYKLKDPSKETIFENCVADVNIPVGEVFTSPCLKETEGVLNVKRVFLNGLEYKDLLIDIKDGQVEGYSCSNFDSVEENKKYIKDNILYRHETLPIGEFAIGTNTVAYTMARKYNIENKLPILIAEKTGPHFALGDTCYSNAEEIKVYNPDGKEIVAKDNEYSLLRDTDPKKAYFNCHTDITIPYDELGEISVVTFENEVITIIENGRFVLPGTELLNEAL